MSYTDKQLLSENVCKYRMIVLVAYIVVTISEKANNYRICKIIRSMTFRIAQAFKL